MTIGIGLLGFGTVGQGVADIVQERRAAWQNLLGEEIKLQKILVRDLYKTRDVDLQEAQLTDDPWQVVNDEQTQIVVELTGNVDQAYQWVKAALQQKKHVVTANKALLSAHFEELSALAADQGVYLLYEGCVAGGVPIIKALKEQLRLNQVDLVAGIINGSTNYMLSKMTREGLEYAQVMDEAKALGYLEADPSADVLGLDAMRKLRILSTLALGASVFEKDILVSGIDRIQGVDIALLKKQQRLVKLVGLVQRVADGYISLVEPRAYHPASFLSQVDGAMNAVTLHGNFIGDLTFVGAGAGRYPTANAVVSDVLDVLFKAQSTANPIGKAVLANRNERIQARYYVRSSAERESALAGLAEQVVSQQPYCVLTRNVARELLQPWLEDRQSCVICLEETEA